MTTSRKLIVALVAIGAVALIGGIIAVRVILESDSADQFTGERVDPSDVYVSRQFEYDNVRSFETVGGWQVELVDDDTLTVLVPENVEPYLRVDRNGSAVTVALDSSVRVLGQTTLRASVPRAALERIDGAGALTLDIGGGAFGTLEIEGAGVLNVKGRARIGRLLVDANGIANLGLLDAQVVSADVRINGAGNADILMAGGTLGGSLSGAATLTYYGSVSSVDVRTSGASRVNEGSR